MKNNSENIQPDQKPEAENNPEEEKIREIAKRSRQFFIISGPSGSGKTMVIKHLVDHYGFVEPPFLTTRHLRPGEEEIGGMQLDQEEFSRREGARKIFLPAYNYGNAYGADLDIIFSLAMEGKNIVVEVPALNLLTDIAHFLPECTVIGILPGSREELETQLISRGMNDDDDRRVRLQAAEDIKEQIIHASQSMKIAQVVPTHGTPENTLSQIEKLLEEKGFKKKSDE